MCANTERLYPTKPTPVSALATQARIAKSLVMRRYSAPETANEREPER